jgi:Flp pilus assembly protein TadG
MSLSSKSKNISGQGLVEFALLLPALLLLIIGTLDFGSAFFIKVALENSAREGAYYLVYNNSSTARASDFAAVKTAVQVEAENSGLTIPTGDISVTCMEGASVNNNCPSGSTVIVRIEYEHEMALDFFSDGSVELTNEARMQIP